MDRRNSDVNVPLFTSGGFFTVEYVNGVTTVSLHHFPSLPSTMEADGIERPEMNPTCVPAVSVHSPFSISGQRELGGDRSEGGSFNQQNKLNSEVPLNDERELSRRDINLSQQYADRISQQGTAFQEKETRVLQPKSRKRSSDTLELESTKKLKQNSLKSESLGWCSLCEIDCIKEEFLKHHILGKKHKKMLKKLKKRDIIGNSEKNDKQVEEVGIRQKKHKRSSIKQQMKGVGITPKKPNMSTKLQNFSKKECKICDVSVFNQGDFESHIAGKKHAKMLKISEFSESLFKSKVNSKECINAYGKESVSSDYGSMLKGDVDKTVEAILDLTDDGGLKANKNDINEFANTDFKESGASDYGPLII